MTTKMMSNKRTKTTMRKRIWRKIQRSVGGVAFPQAVQRIQAVFLKTTDMSGLMSTMSDLSFTQQWTGIELHC